MLPSQVYIETKVSTKARARARGDGAPRQEKKERLPRAACRHAAAHTGALVGAAVLPCCVRLQLRCTAPFAIAPPLQPACAGALPLRRARFVLRVCACSFFCPVKGQKSRGVRTS